MLKNVPDRKSGGNSGLDSKVSVFGYFFICLNMLFFGWLNSADPYTFLVLTGEDYWVENLTAVWFFLASLLFFTTAGAEQDVFRRTVYILGGIALLFAAGEEISWGQRIVGFSTPDFLMNLNFQKEFNLHNIPELKIDKWDTYGVLMLCMVTCMAFFCDKKFLSGIPVPSLLLALGAMTTTQFDDPGGASILSAGFISICYLLISLFAIYVFISRHAKLIIPSISTAALILAIAYVNSDYVKTVELEVYEYLTGIVCLLLSIELVLSQESTQRKIATLINGLKGLKPLPYHLFPRRAEMGRKGPLPPDPPLRKSGVCRPLTWPMVCFIVFACSIGLAFFHYFNGRALAAVVSGEPTVRSTFDIYLTENRMIYFKEPCGPADITERFFLHLIPANVNDLPTFREQHGFDSLSFDFITVGTISDGRCLVTVVLPRYTIVSIRTGQFISGKDKIWHKIWQAEFPFHFDDRAVAAAVAAATSGEPTVQSTFDIYLTENRMIYFKEPCGPADITERFFLHLIPANVNDLPAFREQHGFDNLDFDFRVRGTIYDGRCLAAVVLPRYAIVSIRTGQFIPGEGEVWQAEFPFRE